jgi:hypothetical protein
MKKKVNTTTIHVVTGDITRTRADVYVKTDALIITIDSTGEVHDHINALIQGISNYYHDYLRIQTPLEEFDVIFAQGSTMAHVTAGFNSVIFVIDDKEPSHEEDVFLGLNKADTKGLISVAMPFFSEWSVRDADEERMLKAINATLRGLERFFAEHPKTSLEDILFVFENAPALQKLFEARLDALKIG